MSNIRKVLDFAVKGFKDKLESNEAKVVRPVKDEFGTERRGAMFDAQLKPTPLTRIESEPVPAAEGGDEGPCYCEQFAEQYRTNEQGHVVKTPDGSGKWLNWACARALRYTLNAGVWSNRTASNAVYRSGEGCDEFPNSVSWFFNPSDADLQSYLDLMTTPPVPGGHYQITFYFSTDRWRVALGPPGLYGWYGSESDSGVHLMAICYRSLI